MTDATRVEGRPNAPVPASDTVSIARPVLRNDRLVFEPISSLHDLMRLAAKLR